MGAKTSGIWAGILVAMVAGVPWKAAAETPKKDTKKASVAANPTTLYGPMTEQPIKLVPEGLRWAMTRAQLEALVDKYIDDDFRHKYQKTTSPVTIRNLDAQVADQKSAFRRSYIELTPAPTGLDSGPLASEYTKGNGEALMSHHPSPGVRMWFFFIQSRLWKTYEEVSLVEGGPYGKEMKDAAMKLIESVGNTMPRTIPADPDKGKYYEMHDWQDALTHLRIWDRSGVLAIVREEKATLANLPSLRRNNGNSSSDRIDPQVAAILRTEPKEEPAPPPPKDIKEQKGKR